MTSEGVVWPPDDEPLTEWERDFLASLDAWEAAPTPAQQDKLDEIEQLLGERSEARQRGWRSRP
jgi:hypothetical protein